MVLNKKQYNLVFDIGIFLVIALIFISIGKNILDVISPFVISLVVAYLLNPLVTYLQKKRINKIISILIVFLIIILIVVGIFMTFIPKLSFDLSVLGEDIPFIINAIVDFVNDLKNGTLVFIPIDVSAFIDLDAELANLADIIKQYIASFSSKVIASTGKLVNIIMIPIITFYFLKDKEEFLSSISDALPIKVKRHIYNLTKDIDIVIGGFIRGQLTIALFVGILTGIGCKVIGIPYTITIGVIAGLTNIIPYFGPWLGGIMPIVLALTTNPILALWVLIWIIIVQQIESNFLSPQIMSQSVGLHPITVMFSILLFGNIFGILGMIIGVPIVGATKVLVKYIVNYRKNLRSIDKV